jgi:drug/metabolite transporter (DMT)-like permease
MLAVVAATISYGFASLWGRRFKTVSPLFTSMAQLACSAVMLAPLVLIVERPWTVPAPSMGASAALVGLAVLSTALAFVIFFRVMAEAGALNAMLVTLLVPISATAFGVVLLGETLTARQILGAAVIAAALAILDGRIVRWAGTSLRGR